MDDEDPFVASDQVVTPSRPLLGLTVLLVEDSRYASEAIRLMCLRSGARIRRADCLKSARQHLQVYHPAVVIVDLGLPDGSGADLIEELSDALPRIGVILGLSGDLFAEDTAIAAGADGFLTKPIRSLAKFQTEIMSHMPADRRVARADGSEDEMIHPDRLAFHDDIAHVADVLNEQSEGKVLDYVAQFVRGVARSANDVALADAADSLAWARATGGPVAGSAARMAGLIQQRLQDSPVI